MRRIPPRLATRALLPALIAGCALLPACSHCPSGTTRNLSGPALVIEDLTAAYAERDTAALGRLLPSDFVYNAGWLTWGRREEMVTSTFMFDPKFTKEVSIRFPCGCRVSPGAAEGTWLLDRIAGELKVVNADTTLSTHERDMRFYVREDPVAPHGYVIYRWESDAITEFPPPPALPRSWNSR